MPGSPSPQPIAIRVSKPFSRYSAAEGWPPWPKTPSERGSLSGNRPLARGVVATGMWPTIPQIYINGKFVGGSDILTELAERGELEALVKG